MYKSKFHKGTCSVCSRDTDVITIGLLNNERYNRDYCVSCSGKYKATITNYINILANYFRVPISVEDLVLYYDFDSLERCLTSYAIRDDDFVVMVNKRISECDSNCSWRSKYCRSLYIRLSKIHKMNFFVMDPYKFRIYEKSRKCILEETHISCSTKISENEYNILIQAMNKLYPLPV